jgi:hypothetical protein
VAVLTTLIGPLLLRMVIRPKRNGSTPVPARMEAPVPDAQRL